MGWLGGPGGPAPHGRRDTKQRPGRPSRVPAWPRSRVGPLTRRDWFIAGLFAKPTPVPRCASKAAGSLRGGPCPCVARSLPLHSRGLRKAGCDCAGFHRRVQRLAACSALHVLWRAALLVTRSACVPARSQALCVPRLPRPLQSGCGKLCARYRVHNLFGPQLWSAALLQAKLYSLAKAASAYLGLPSREKNR